MAFTIPRLYPITDVLLSGLSHPEQVEQLVLGGARLIQLRAKNLSARDFHDAAVESIRVARRFGARIVINDRVDVALSAAADGVHLGQEDLPAEAARRLLGSGCLIGVSTHNLEQAQAIDYSIINYLAIGPVFSTTTKENPNPVIGLEMIRQVRAICRVPLVAIGGITLDKAPAVLAAGADFVAIVSDLYCHGDIAGRTRKMIARLG